MCCCCVERPPPLASALASRSSAAIITATGEHSAELRLRRGQLQADSGWQARTCARASAGANFFFRGFCGLSRPSFSFHDAGKILFFPWPFFPFLSFIFHSRRLRPYPGRRAAFRCAARAALRRPFARWTRALARGTFNGHVHASASSTLIVGTRRVRTPQRCPRCQTRRLARRAPRRP